MDKIDELIRQLYRKSIQLEANVFKEQALRMLHEVIPFDGAMWATGSFEKDMHSVVLLELDSSFSDTLMTMHEVNPLVRALPMNLGSAVDMQDVISDDEFYQSDMYKQCFSQFGIERILSSAHVQYRSGVFTVLSLYRFNREDVFSEEEKELQSRALFHLLSAASHNQLFHLKQVQQNNAAICDIHGFIYEAEPEFLDLVDTYYKTRKSNQLPIMPDVESEQETEYLMWKFSPLGDLFCVEIWPKGILDILTAREKEVVQGVSSGKTFKEIAKELSLSPSTVSNHLYKIYNKLNISSRSELAALVKDN